jgi:iron complex outermembrane receptor protein
MRIQFYLLFVLTFYVAATQAQTTDTVKLLQPILIQAYSADRPLTEIPASIAHIEAENLNRFSNTNLLPAVNAIPGVRMEERSPGSYRFSIRGSLLRSPFGVRNVKAYWNGLPLTDGGGNTYLNLLDFNSIGTLEVIKGPGGSLYGAGTGGVILLNNPTIKNNHLEASTLIGSYGLRRYQFSGQIHSEKINARIQYAHQQTDGYRAQTAMKREAFNADVTFKLNAKSILSATLFYTDLFYETPGGLTRIQYDEDPSQARPPGGPNRGAVEQQASVTNKTPYVGLSFDHEWNERWSTRIGIMGSQSSFVNPTIRNYEEREESNVGARTETQFKFGAALKNKITMGGEYQSFKGPLKVFDNNFGVKGAVQTDDDLASKLMFVFGQAEFELPAQFYFTIGGSLNFLSYDFKRFQPAPVTSQSKKFDAVFSPRIALLKKLTESFSIYGNVSKGFSPPSLAEVRPSTNEFNNDLQAETGTNYELGFRGNTNDQKILFDITLYDFRLNETIVIQRAADNAEYFVNAGKTSQQGIEAMVSWQPIKTEAGFLTNLKLWNSYACNHYRFKEYVQDGNDYSGNKLTGIPPTVNTSGLDLVIKQKFYLNVTGSYVDHVPLVDANTSFASQYLLMGSRLGFKTNIADKNELEIFAGVDNALDKKYSLGNDLNAVGGRFFNAAPQRNFYAGIRIRLIK